MKVKSQEALTTEEVLRLASEEGLTLIRSEAGTSGYAFVRFDADPLRRRTPYHAPRMHSGGQGRQQVHALRQRMRPRWPSHATRLGGVGLGRRELHHPLARRAEAEAPRRHERRGGVCRGGAEGSHWSKPGATSGYRLNRGTRASSWEREVEQRRG